MYTSPGYTVNKTATVRTQSDTVLLVFLQAEWAKQEECSQSELDIYTPYSSYSHTHTAHQYIENNNENTSKAALQFSQKSSHKHLLQSSLTDRQSKV